MIGTVRQILHHEEEEFTLIVLNECQVGGERHPKWYMPTVHVAGEDKLIIVVVAVSIYLCIDRNKRTHHLLEHTNSIKCAA